jgi:hypothetical protein
MAHIPTATHEKFEENGDGIFKPVGQTLNEPIELNNNFTILEIRMQYEYLNAIDKVYAHIINKAWLYEQPQSTEPFPKRANVPNASTTLKTLLMNLKILTIHIVLLHILGSNPTTPKYVNIIGCKKGPVTPCSQEVQG